MIKEYQRTYKTVYSERDDVTLIVTDIPSEWGEQLYQVISYHFGDPDNKSIDYGLAHTIGYPIYIKKGDAI